MSPAAGTWLAKALFWTSAGTIAATYVGFPVALLVRGALRHRPIRTDPGAPLPSISVIVAAHDEAAEIGGRLDDLLDPANGHPPLEVVVASDGSTDGTNEIVASYADRGVVLLALPRVGKADALTAAVAASHGEILVFTDANTRFATGAVAALVAPFGDPEVGGVAGDQVYIDGIDEDGTAVGERAYWDLDRRLKVAESRAGNVVSATGAIYAVRRSLFRPVVSGVTDDFITSVSVIDQGQRLVFAEDAIAYEPPARSGGDEFGRKVRIMTRGLRGTILMRHLMDPRRTGSYALQLLWHKLLRRVMVVPLIGLLASSLALVGRGPLYTLAALAQLAAYGLAAVGLASRGQPLGRKKVVSVPAYFVMVNAAALKAIVDIARGRRIDRWDPVRPGGGSARPSTADDRSTAPSDDDADPATVAA
jgi:cellulose synthase/poly-beta-1,6-N-acetylglucosamine synthase-like glycosyltransferase